MNKDWLSSTQHELYEFINSANQSLSEEHSLFYGGNFLTGKIDRPTILFVGINPGFSLGEWTSRNRDLKATPFTEMPCKYAEEYKDQCKLAKSIVDVVLGGDLGRLKECAETSLRSFFATPNEAILNKQLDTLRHQGFDGKHEELMKNYWNHIIKKVMPDHIVCIGLSTFHRYVKFSTDTTTDISTRNMPSKSGKTKPTYYKKTILNGIPTHGLIHLSGAHPSSAMLDDLQAIFSNVFAQA